MLAYLLRSKGRHHAEAAQAVGFADLFGQCHANGAVTARRIVVVGNCLAEGIQKRLGDALRLVPGQTVSALPLHLVSVEDRLSQEQLIHATHVVAQRIGAVDLIRLGQLAPTAKLIEFQDVVFRSTWPFEGVNGFRDESLSVKSGCPIRHVDGALARLRVLEPNQRKRIQRYADLDFDLAASISRVADAQERFLAGIDDRPELTLGRYILENFRDIQLFHDSTHPASSVFDHLVTYSCNAIEMCNRNLVASLIDDWQNWSLPVHPQIAKQLGIKWANEETRYHYGTLGRVTWREWVEAYVELLG